jgi:hypothetical protein
MENIVIRKQKIISVELFSSAKDSDYRQEAALEKFEKRLNDFIGKLTRDPELQWLQSSTESRGVSCTQLTVIVSYLEEAKLKSALM